MGSRGGDDRSGGGGAPWRPAWAACLALCLLLSRCSPCHGRKMLEEEEVGGRLMHFEGGIVLRVLPRGGGSGAAAGEEEGTAAVPAGFSASGGAGRAMRSVPSPGVGH